MSRNCDSGAVSGSPSASGGSANAPRIASQTPRTRIIDAAIQSIPEVRTQIGREMDKEIIVCSVQNFMESYLPFVASNETLERVKDILREKELITENPLQFTMLPSQTTKKFWGRSKEQKAFAPLGDIAKAIGEYRFPENSPARNNFNYRDCPTTSLSSDIDGSTHKNDACFTSDSSNEKQLSKTGMAVPIEFKLNAFGRMKNNAQVVSANVQIMNEDLRRMFTFGISIEGGLATLWYHGRSHSAASEQFSFVEKPITLIQVFMAFMFGTPEQLGYDPYVILEDDRRYTFTIPAKPNDILNTKSRRFRSIKPITDYRVINITGRMSRILLVEELDTGDEVAPRFVLKDVWLEKEAKTERELQTAIFNDIIDFWKEKSSASSNESLQPFKVLHADLVNSGEFKKYFLEIVGDYTGNLSKAVASGAVPTRGLLDVRYISPTDPAPIMSRQSKATAGASHPRGAPDTNALPIPDPSPRNYLQKQQYRVVFKEYCTAIGDLGTLGEVVDLLEGVLTPLRLLFCAGWVHRDISSGNILAYRSTEGGWQAKLADLEYAKKFPPLPGHTPSGDPKTHGTPFFMAHEILSHYQLYAPRRPTVKLIRQDSNPRPIVAFGKRRDQAVPDNADIPTLLTIHNFQHDLESVWWILLWTLTCRVDHSPSQLWGTTRFQNSGQLSHNRAKCILDDIRKPLESVLHESVKALAQPMNLLRVLMKQAFEIRQTNDHINEVGTYAPIHVEFHDAFDTLSEYYGTAWRSVRLGNGVIRVKGTHDVSLNNPVSDPSQTSTAEVNESEATSNASALSASQRVNGPPVSSFSPARLTKRHFEESHDSSDSEADVELSRMQANLVSQLYFECGSSGSKRQKYDDDTLM